MKFLGPALQTSQGGTAMGYQGAWSPFASYALGDTVLYAGLLWTCTSAVTGPVISVVGESGAGPTTGAFNMPLPGGCQVGDLAVVTISMGASVTPTTPSGLTVLQASTSATTGIGVYSRSLIATDITNGYLAMPAQTGGNPWAATAHVYRGNILVAAAATSPSLAMFTTTSYAAGYIYTSCAVTASTTATVTPPVNVVDVRQQVGAASTVGLVAAGDEQMSPGTTPGGSWTFSTGSNPITATVYINAYPDNAHWTTVGIAPSLTHAKGDLIVGTGNAVANLPVGSDGQVLTAASGAANGLSYGYPATPALARLRQTASQTLTTSGTTYAVSFGTADVDNLGGWAASPNPSRYTVQLSGYYWIWGEVFYTSNATGARRAALYTNGSELTENNVAAASGSTTGCTIAALVFLSAGTYIELMAMQTSGGSLTTFASGFIGSALNIMWMHP